jgi:hypothetical protein
MRVYLWYVNSSDPAVSNGIIIGEQWTEKDVEGSDNGLIRGTMTPRVPQKALVKMADCIPRYEAGISRMRGKGTLSLPQHWAQTLIVAQLVSKFLAFFGTQVTSL